MPDRPDETAPGSLYEDWDLLRRLHDDLIQIAGVLGVKLEEENHQRATQLKAIVDKIPEKVRQPDSWQELLERLFFDKELERFIGSLLGRGGCRDASTRDDVRSDTPFRAWLITIRKSGGWFRNRGSHKSWWPLLRKWLPTEASRAAERILGPPKLRPTGQSTDDTSVTPPEQTLDSGDLPPDIQAESRELWDRMCEGLSAEERQVLEFRGEGMNNKDIASELGLDLETVKKRVRSARRKLRKKFKDKLAQLAPDDSQMIDLVFFQRKTIPKIALALVISCDEAKHRLSKAMRGFKELLDP